jgi:poly-beta-1,6-N-acetyl-D-glucosamine synthase
MLDFFPHIFWPLLLALYAAATAAQLAAWWGIFARALTWRARPIPEGEKPVSVVICARNEAENLRRHLPKILAQRYAGAWEVVVVDDASDDETPAVLQFFLEKNARLRVVRIPRKEFPGKKHALAQGIAAARFDALLLTDADCAPASEHWIARMAALLHEKSATEIVLGYGPVRPAEGPLPWGLAGWVRFEAAHTAIQYCALALVGMPYMGVGRNLVFRRAAFERVGGFGAHAHLVSGDDDLLVNAAARAGNVAICLDYEAFMSSEGKKTWRAWWLQKRRHVAASRAYRWLHWGVLGALSVSHILHYFLLLVLLLADFGTKTVVLLYFARLISVTFLYGRIAARSREPRLLAWIPMYDALLAAYYGTLVPLALIGNHSHAWKQSPENSTPAP